MAGTDIVERIRESSGEVRVKVDGAGVSAAWRLRKSLRHMASCKRHLPKGVFGSKNAIWTQQKAFSGVKTPSDRCLLRDAICRTPFAGQGSDWRARPSKTKARPRLRLVRETKRTRQSPRLQRRAGSERGVKARAPRPGTAAAGERRHPATR